MFRAIYYPEADVKAKVGDVVRAMRLSGDFEMGEVTKVNPKSITVKFEEGVRRLPVIWDSFGHIIGGLRGYHYHLQVKE